MAPTIKPATAAVSIAAKGVSNAYDKFGSLLCQRFVEVVTIICAAEGELQTADTAKTGFGASQILAPQMTTHTQLLIHKSVGPVGTH